MTEPAQRRGFSKQSYTTPSDFVAACEAKFGPIALDLAATAENRIVPQHFGPGSLNSVDSLTSSWHTLLGLLWLNPPFDNITSWAKKCATESQQGAEILFLVPASVGANWFWDHVAPFAVVYQVGRLIFGGQEPPLHRWKCKDDMCLGCVDPDTWKPQPFPKDLMLCHYGAEGGLTPRERGYVDSADVRRWLWRAERKAA